MNLSKITRAFGAEGLFMPTGNGHINDTYRSIDDRFLLQRINTDVFKNPAELMENIENVTSFIREKIRAQGGDYERGTLEVVKTLDGASFVVSEDGDTYRMYRYIRGTKTVEPGDNDLSDLEAAGRAFGNFQKMLQDYDASTLHESIPDFHDTVKRVEAFKKAVSDDVMGRCEEVADEIEQALKWAEFAGTVLEGLKDGSIPLAVTHNDTKINNVLFDEKTGEPLAVIDLDTVMPGSRLYDFGDALRAAGNTAAEDEPDIAKVHFNNDAYRAFTRGYLSEMGNVLTPREIELLPFSIILLTYECGIRFLGDYLNGDTYFKIHREKQNLDRCHTQFRMVSELLEKEAELQEITRELLG